MPQKIPGSGAEPLRYLTTPTFGGKTLNYRDPKSLKKREHAHSPPNLDVRVQLEDGHSHERRCFNSMQSRTG